MKPRTPPRSQPRNQRLSSTRQRKQQHLLDVKVRSRAANRQRNRRLLTLISALLLICGAAGCGKTLLGMTFLVNGATQFDEPGLYTLQCDVHPWMQCWVMVLKEGYFGVTGLDGKFKLQSSDMLLDGDYKIDAWHPRFAQTLEQTIHVKNGTAHADFHFDGAKSF